MIGSKALFLREETYLGRLMIILIAICFAGLIVLGFGKISLGILCLLAVFLCAGKIENLFLLFLLTFSFFSIDEMSFLIVGTHPIITYDRVFVALLFFIFLKQIALRERKLLPFDKIEIIFIFLIIIVGFSVATKSLNKLMGARVLTDVFFIPFIVYVLSKNLITDKKYFKKFVSVLFIVGIYLSMLAFYEHFTKKDIFSSAPEAGVAVQRMVQEDFGWVRPNGPYPNDTTLAVCTAFCFFIVLYKYITLDSTKTYAKLSHVIVLVMISIAIFFTLYRGIWLAWILGLLTWLLIRRRQLLKLSFVLLLLVVLIMPFFIKFLESDFASEFYQHRVANVANIQDRLERFGYALSFFKESPIDGIGFQNYTLIMKTASQHNQILAMLSETGLIGASAYVLLFLFLFHSSIKNYRFARDKAWKEFSLIYLSIIVVFLIAGLGLTIGLDNNINLLLFAISGAALGPKRDTLLE